MPNRPNLLGQLKKVLCEIDDCGCCLPCCPPSCPPPNLLGQIKTLLNDIDDCGPCPPPCCPAPCCPPSCCPPPCPPKKKEERPYAQVCFTCPPYGPLPTIPNPVKPLQMPTVIPGCPKTPEEVRAEEDLDYERRLINFYNNYNYSYRKLAICPPKRKFHERCCDGERANGVTVDGQSPCCTCVPPNCEDEPTPKRECPTGFKPCFMKMSPPECCNPIGIWRAELKPCPPGYRRKPPKPRYRDGCCCE